jgi:hypothetical protein
VLAVAVVKAAQSRHQTSKQQSPNKRRNGTNRKCTAAGEAVKPDEMKNSPDHDR